MGIDDHKLGSAIADFHRARGQAALKELLARLTGDSVQLLSFDEVRKTMRIQGGVERGLKDIPLNAIVGSVGRYADFTRDFLPRRDINPERWARVLLAANGLIGLPPIEVYQIGEVYFVKDGNHRVSVARQMGAEFIQGYVTEVQTRVPITPDMELDEILLKAEYGQFLQQTHLDELRPEANLDVTAPGKYPLLLEHIEIHRYYMGLDNRRDVSLPEAVAHWYDTVYLPVVEMIRSRGILRHFPERTETDLYIWLAEHRAQLEQDMGWEVRPEYAANLLVEDLSPQSGALLSRLSRLWHGIIPDRLESGPLPGQWRAEPLTSNSQDDLFKDILVPLNGKEDGWYALEQAVIIARREGSRLHGLHVLAPDDAAASEPFIHALQNEFAHRCQEAGVEGRMTIATGDVVNEICRRARLVDLITVNLSYPPAPQWLARLNSGVRDMIARCPRPILATPKTTSPLNKAFLAFDGSPKAQEALYVAAYLAGAWKIPLVVASFEDESRRIGEATLAQACEYLSAHGVESECVLSHESMDQSLLEMSQALGCDFIILGGYGLAPVLEVLLGSAMDNVLRSAEIPLLICQ